MPENFPLSLDNPLQNEIFPSTKPLILAQLHCAEQLDLAAIFFAHRQTWHGFTLIVVNAVCVS